MKQPDRSLVAALDPFMLRHGFKFLRSRGVYIRKQEGGFDDFSWGSYPLATGKKWQAGYFEGHYGLGKRNDQIAEIFDILDLTYGEENKRYRPIVYRSVGGFCPFDPSRDRELCLRFDHFEADVAETADRIEAMLEAEGFAWYDRYTDPASLSRDINDPPGLDEVGPHPLVNNTGQRPLCGVAAACVGEPHRVGDLVDNYLREARKIDETWAAETKGAFAPRLEQRLGMIVEEARRKGCRV